jgi:hypothetical protein
MHFFHLFDVEDLLALRVLQRYQLDVDVGLALRGVMQVQHALALARLPGLGHGTAFAAFVARPVEVVRHLVAGSPDHRGRARKPATVSRVGRQDAVALVEQDVGLGEAVEVGQQFGRWGAGHGWVLVLGVCQMQPEWQFIFCRFGSHSSTRIAKWLI